MNSDENCESHLNREISSKREEKTIKQFKCTIEGCNAVYQSSNGLKRHLLLHNNERPFKCTYTGCNKSYTNSSHLKRHTQTHSDITITYQCTLCPAKISTISNLKRHYKRAHNPNRDLYCTECQTFFIKKNRYEEHIESHKNSLLYKCATCGKLFPTHLKLMAHAKNHKAKKLHKCPYENCEEVFEKWALMLKHKKDKHSNIEHHCQICNKFFKNKYHYKDHLKIHKDNRPAIACPYENCNRLYYFKKNLNNHIRLKHIGKKFICDECGCKLSSKQNIEKHIISIHLSEKKPLQRKSPLPRKDAGMIKKTMLSELTGIHLTAKAERQLMKRNPAALLRDKAVEDFSSYSEDECSSDISAKGA